MNTQQPPYNPMANMMQILQLAMQQNQAGQAQANQNRNFGLEQQQLDMRGQQFDQQAAMQKVAQEQQQQQHIMAALSRAIPQNAQGFDDPSVLFNYLKQMGVEIPGMAQQAQADDPQAQAARAMFSQLGQ